MTTFRAEGPSIGPRSCKRSADSARCSSGKLWDVYGLAGTRP